MIEQTTNILKSIINTLNVESEAIKRLIQFLDSDVEQIVNLLYDSRSRVLVTGIGKSAIIGQKIVATFNSTGTAAHFLHASDAVHGDLGMIQPEDIVICISNSGNTPEIKKLVQIIKQRKNTLIALVGKKSSFLYQESDYRVLTTVDKEAGPNNLAPTASTTAQLAIGDAIAVAVLEKRNFGIEDFAKLHPGGMIGKRLYWTVEDLAKSNPQPQVAPSDSIKDVIVAISSNRLGATAVIENAKILGVITDGDLRRMLSEQSNLEGLVAKDIMSTSPKSVAHDFLAIDAVKILNEKGINQLIVTKAEDYIGMVHIHDLIREGII